MDARSSAGGALRALGDGGDAVMLVRVQSSGDLFVDVVNDPARVLFGLGDEASVRLVDDRCPPDARALLDHVRESATRERATRENVALPSATATRLVVDLQLEPLPPTNDGE